MSGRPRVAHVTAQSASIIASLEQKRLSLAAVASRVNGSMTKKSDIRNLTPVKRKRRNEESEEEDEFIADDVESDDSFCISDDEEREEARPKRKTPTNLAPAKPKPTALLVTAPVKSERTLSESSDDEEWLGKSSALGSQGKKMQTKVQAQEPKAKRRVITSFSGESEEENVEDVPIAPARKRAYISSDEEYEDADLAAESDERESTPDSDSDAEERRRTRRETKQEKMCTEFFNNASRADLIAELKASDKMAGLIESKRPFDFYVELEEYLCEIPHGKKALQNYFDQMENRGILENVLNDCKGHADSVEADFERCTEQKLQPSNLALGYNLHDYQKIGISWLIMMYRKGFNCILGDEMGLGKTIQIVAFLAWLKEQKIDGPHLVVVPSSTIENWIGEIRRWCPDLKLLTYYGSQEERKGMRSKAKKKKEHIDVVLTTYNMIASKSDDKKFFKNFSMNYVIYDEGHMLKNCSTDRYKNLMKVKGKRKILLTGTPLQNNLIELISLMYFVMTKVFNRYCDDITQLLSQFKALGPALDSSSVNMYNKDRIEQAKLILQPYILRRLKSQVLTLPAKHEEIVEVEMGDKQKDVYENVLDTYRNSSGDAGTASAALMKLRQAANHPLLTRLHYDDQMLRKIAKVLCAKEKPYERKVAAHVAEDLSFSGDFQIHQLCEKFKSTKKFLLDEDLALQSGKCKELDKRLPKILEKKEKVLIFSQFTMMLDILEVYLRVRGHQFLRLDGSTPVLERQELINRFNVDEGILIFLLSTKAGGLGINLTSANHIIIHDLDFNPYNDKQAEDRCHRMGQTKPVYVTRFISKESVESGMLSLAKKKLQLEKQVTVGIKGQLDDDEEATRDSNDSDEAKPTAEELQNLLKGAMEHKGVE